jgi:inward rectifier potassium channel
MRRVADLVLHRNRSPVFTLSWTLMHTIDEESPLYGIDLKDPECHVLGLVCSLIGYDSTYGQQAHARHTYQLGDLLIGHRFVDVLSTLEDDRIMIDYHKFDDTVAE